MHNGTNYEQKHSWSIEKDECNKRFRVLSVLGEGTYGVVYKAIDVTTDKVSFFIFYIQIKSNHYLLYRLSPSKKLKLNTVMKDFQALLSEK